MTDDSHGFRYELAAAVARRAVLTRLARLQPTAQVVPLRVAGLGLLPVTNELTTDLSTTGLCAIQPTEPTTAPTSTDSTTAALLTGPESGFTVLTPNLLALFEIGSHTGPIAYLEADYLGREGCQSAVMWRNGQVTVGPLLLGRHEVFSSAIAPISVALRALGVTATGRRDEFVVAGLGRCRSTHEWAQFQGGPPC
jgi:hypothetical protein